MGIRLSKVIRTTGVAVYIVLTRTAMTVAVVFTALFFILNSSPFPNMIAKALIGVIPGYFEFGRIQVSPIPWIIDVTDVSINTPKGRPIIQSELVRVRIKLVPLLKFVLHPETKELPIQFASVRLDNFDVQLRFDDRYHLELVDAFDFPGSLPPSPHPLLVKLGFDRITGTNGHVYLEFPEWDLRVDGIDMKVDMKLVTPPIDILVRAEYFNYMSGIAHIRAGRDIAQIPRTVLMRQGFVDDFVYHWDEISFGRFRAGFDFGSMDASDGYLSWGRNLKYTLSARLDLPEGSNAVRTATNGLLSGPIELEVNGHGDSHDPHFNIDLVSPSIKLERVDLGRVECSLAGGRDAMGVFGIRDVSLSARTGRTRFDLTEGEFLPSPPDAAHMWRAAFGLDFAGLDVGGLLDAFGIRMKSPALPVPGVLEGNLKIDATATAASIEGPAVPGTELAFGVAGRLGGTLRRSGVLDGRSFQTDLESEVSWRDISRPSVSFSKFRFRSGRDEMALSGMVDLSADRLALAGRVSKELSSMTPVTGTRLEGFVDISGLNLRGALSSPSGSARVTLDGFAWKRWKVAQASADLSIAARKLGVRNFRALTPFGQVTAAAGTVPLPLDGPGLRGRRLEIADIAVSGLDLSRIPVLAGTGIDGFGHARARDLSFDMSAPGKTISSRVSIDLTTLRAAGRFLQTVSVQGDLKDGRIAAMAADAVVRGGGNLSVSGNWDLAADRLELSGSLDDVPLGVLLGLNQGSPFGGKVSIEAAMTGRPSDPELEGSVRLDELTFRKNRLAPVRFTASRRTGGDMYLSSDRLFNSMKVGADSRVVWQDGGFRALKLDLDIRNLSPQDIFPDVPTRKLAGGLTARLQLDVPSFAKGTLVGSLDSPPDGLWVEFFNRQARLENRDRLVVRMENDGRFVVSGVRLDDGESEISLCGVNTSDGIDLMVRGAVGAHWLRALRGVFSSADGLVELQGRDRFVPGLPEGCDASMREGGGSLLISGTLADPIFDGQVKTGSVALHVRNLVDPLRIDPGGRIVLSRAESGGRPVTDISIPDEHWISGLLGEGSFNLSGKATLAGGRLENGLVKVKGSQLRYVSPGEFFLVAEPRLEATFNAIRLWGDGVRDLAPEIGVSGQVDISDGAYHKNFNVVRRAFSGMTGGRVAERASRSMMEAVPWLGDTKLNVAIRAPSFGVRTRLVVGQTDLDLNMNLRLLGTLRYPELWDRIEVVSGGTFTYDVVRREFEVTRGTVDFDGDYTHPQIDLQARTRVEYKNASDSVVSASRFNADDSQDSFYSDMIQVNLAVSGTYPDLDIQITSPTRGLSQNDLQVLLLTGMAPGESIADSGGSFVNVNLLTGGVTDSLVKVLLADLVDSVSFGVTAGGDVNLDVSAHMGRRLKFQTQVQQGSGSSQYSTGFKIRLTDGLSLEGRLRAVEYSVDQEDVGRNYDTKLRYRIPIE